MKPRKVKRLDPEGTLGDNVERIVRVRLDELCAYMPRAGDPEEVEALHDMRIAAKRLRYALEPTADIFGPYARTAMKRTKELQDVLGTLHDCDVTLPRIEALIAELRESEASEIRRRAADAADLDPALVAGAPNLDAFRGLETMAVYVRARRALVFDRFLELWTDLQRQGFRARLEFAVGERFRPVTSRSPSGNGPGPVEAIPSQGSPA